MSASSRDPDRLLSSWPFLAAWATSLVFAFGVELWRTSGDPGLWITNLDRDWSLTAIWLLLGLPAWFFRHRLVSLPFQRKWGHESATGNLAFAWGLAILCGIASWSVSAWIASHDVGRQQVDFGSLPPAFHDEYSYLFQAESALAGRMAWPVHPEQPQLFGQMHVLHTDRFASRYFPTTGVWLAPFVAIGHPLWGQWLAGSLSAIAMFFIGRELHGNGCGLLAGLLFAVCPGIALFSNLLLAHHPAMLGLTTFLLFFLRSVRTSSKRDLVLCSTALTFAMLARPMTAAGFAFPCGVWFAISLLRKDRGTLRELGQQLLAMASPILIGFLLLMCHNHAVTGDVLTTGYSKYTNLHTPRHVYGFNNVTRGEEAAGPLTVEHYDRWATNLTMPVALRNLRIRLLASATWTSGPVLILAVFVLTVLSLWRYNRKLFLIAAGIASLHLAHLPYWFTGIMNWHYVFETAPLWILLTASALVQVARFARQSERELLIPWSLMLVGISLWGSYGSEPFAEFSRIDAAVSELSFSRLKYARFETQLDQQLGETKALILVEHDPDDLHIDYVSNHPSLNETHLVGRWSEDVRIEEIRTDFPDRGLYYFDARTGVLRPL